MKHISRRTAAGFIAAAATMPVLSSVAFAQSSATVQLPGGAPDVIALLEAEHKAALGLVDQLIATADPQQRGKLLRQLADALTIHNANEENIVYPAVRDAAHKPADAAKLYHEQDEAKVVISQLTMMPKDSAQFTETVRMLQTALKAHIRQEESIDFPAVRAALGANLTILNQATAQLRAHWVSNPSA
jgi:hemerythrin superfamily protein